jgi:hypothetical protein
MVAGRIEPRDVGRIMATFLPASLPLPAPLPRRPSGATPFLPLPTQALPGRGQTTLTGAAAAAASHIVTVALPPALSGRRQQEFDPAGFWVIRGRRRAAGPSPYPRPRTAAATAQAELDAARAYRPVEG